ncbi:MAG: hypothetical protein IJT95_01780, partial [Abditibacteriota bacterium]|nr:hypothetical protein [Abditibacteriota bacterium]
MAIIFTNEEPSCEAERLICDSLSLLNGEFAAVAPGAVKHRLLSETPESRFFLLIHISGSIAAILCDPTKNVVFADNRWNGVSGDPEKELKAFRKKVVAALPRKYNTHVQLILWFPMGCIPQKEGFPVSLDAVFDGVCLNNPGKILSGLRLKGGFDLSLRSWKEIIGSVTEPPADPETDTDTMKRDFEEALLEALDAFEKESRLAISGPEERLREAALRRLAAKYGAPGALGVCRDPASFPAETGLEVTGGAPEERADTLYVWDADRFSPGELDTMERRAERFYAFYGGEAGLPGTSWLSDQARLCRVTLPESLNCVKSIARAARRLYPEDKEAMRNTAPGMEPFLHILDCKGSGRARKAVEYRIREILIRHNYSQGDRVAVIPLGGSSFRELACIDREGRECSVPVDPEGGKEYECVIITGVEPCHFEGKRRELRDALLRGRRFVHMISLLTKEEAEEFYASFGGDAAFPGRMTEAFGIKAFRGFDWFKDPKVVNGIEAYSATPDMLPDIIKVLRKKWAKKTLTFVPLTGGEEASKYLAGESDLPVADGRTCDTRICRFLAKVSLGKKPVDNVSVIWGLTPSSLEKPENA